MEYNILEKVAKAIESNKRVALATVTEVTGSSPGREGAMMAIFHDGTTKGTVGGGRLELAVAKRAKECLVEGMSKSYRFQLDEEPGSLSMQCGGEATVFIKVFNLPDKLLIVGGGHIGQELYKLGKMLGFHTVIFDNRKEFCNDERFPDADELYHGDIEEKLKQYNLEDNCYVIIVTHGHKHDEVALKAVIKRRTGYIGMIGSRNKTNHVMNNLRKAGIDENMLNNVYAPIGLGLGGNSPAEIAFSIMSEVLLVKNRGQLKHMKDIKR